MIEIGIVTSKREVNWLNAKSPINITEDGITTSVREVHSMNTNSSISINDSDILIKDKIVSSFTGFCHFQNNRK